MMLYLVRHGQAFERDYAKWPDDRGRPLTKKGAARVTRVAAALAGMELPITTLLSSSLARAWQTAKLLHEEAEWPAPRKFELLEPGHNAAEVAQALSKQQGEGVALVGHEPLLSQLGGWLIAGPNPVNVFELKKGGIACIDINGAPVAGRGRLQWLAPPKLLLWDAE